MKVINFWNKYDLSDSPLVLGSFEAFHKGHYQLFLKAQEISNNVSIFSFSNIEKLPKNSKASKFKIFNDIDTHLKDFSNIGFSNVIMAEFDKQFSNQSPEKFIDVLINNFNINTVIVGEDYKFGRNGEGSIELLKSKFKKVHVVKTFKVNGKKLSSGIIKEIIEFGNIQFANTLLKAPWRFGANSINGKTLIPKSKNQLLPQSGIYIGELLINDLLYPLLIHINLSEEIEIRLIDNDIDIKGKSFDIFFYSRHRVITRDTQDMIADIDFEKIKAFFIANSL